MRTLINSIFGGIMIGIGCNVYLSCDNKYVGAILFSIGLITILLFDLNLYTGKVCYIPQYNFYYTKKVIVILLGNAIGCLCIGAMFPSKVAQVICQNKLQIGLWDVLFRSIICNILIYIAVDAYMTKNTLLPTIFCIPTFILSGYEHSIADITYFIMARQFTKEVIIFLTIVIIGNAIGGMLIPLYKTLNNKMIKKGRVNYGK